MIKIRLLLRPVPLAANLSGLALGLGANMLTTFVTSPRLDWASLAAALLYLLSCSFFGLVHFDLANCLDAALAASRAGSGVVKIDDVFHRSLAKKGKKLWILTWVSFVTFFLASVAPSRLGEAVQQLPK